MKRRCFGIGIYDVVADLPDHYELVTNSQDIESWFEQIGYEDNYGDAGCLFVSFEDPEGGVEGYRVFICEDSVPRDSSPIYELYPRNEYT